MKPTALAGISSTSAGIAGLGSLSLLILILRALGA